MRFLTVNVPGEPDHQILLEKPGPPAMDPATAEEVRALLTKGRTGGNLFFTTADARKAYNDLLAKGVEFTQEPTEQPYGIDFGLRDPSATTSGLRRWCPRRRRHQNLTDP